MTSGSINHRRSSKLAACLSALLLASACRISHTDSSKLEILSAETSSVSEWTESERALLESLSIWTLGPAPESPSNRVSDSPQAARLGHRLFFDPGLSADGSIACASCHQPALLYTDGLTTARGIGVTGRNSPSLIGAAHFPWMYWDGRRDSLWAQALAPLEAAAEMGNTRLAVVRRVTTHPETEGLYRQVFGVAPKLDDRNRFPDRAGPFGDLNERAAWTRMSADDRRIVDRAFADIGKAIGAYERLLQPGPSRFDRYVQNLRSGIPATANAELNAIELQGLRLFVDAERTPCLRCHNGPLFTNASFHEVGTASTTDGLPDFGRFLGIQAVLIDPFNCLGPYSDSAPEDCRELRFLNKSHMAAELGKFKTPTLRGLTRTAPYLHDGRLGTLGEVIEHYRNPNADGDQPIEITPLEISDEESRALVAFLASLDGTLATPSRWLEPPADDSMLASADDPTPDLSGNSSSGGFIPASNRPEDAFSKNSEQDVFRVSVWPEDGEIPLRRLHAWVVRVEDANGARVAPVLLTIDGGMPQHGHGFDTRPQVAQRLQNGDYRIDGMKFHMGGDWQLKLQIATDDLADVVNFEVHVGP
jgi:cytochrome c peroxidase